LNVPVAVTTPGKEIMGWACCQTYGASERKAVTNLRRQGFEAFSPFYLKPPHLIKKHAAKDAPVFPCYVFVSIADQYQSWRPINSTFGVIRLLTNRSIDDPKPLWVEDSYIESLRRLEDKDQDNSIPINTVVCVRHRDSPFYNQVGTVYALDRQQRLTILMQLFNREVKVLFESAQDLEILHYPDGYQPRLALTGNE